MRLQPLRLPITLFAVMTLACNFLTGLIPSGDARDEPSLLLNEVLFLPEQGQPQFIELKNAGPDTGLEGYSLHNEAGLTYVFPPGSRLNSGEVVLILFDGGNNVEGDTVHADRTDFLNSESGFVELKTSDGTLLDRVAWGADQPGSVRLGRGGVPSDIGPGVTIGRFPASVAVGDRFEWVTFLPDETTPGLPNRNPGVRILLPLDGALLEGPQVSLSWYSIAGAAEYHLQLAADEPFTSPILDETSETVGITTAALADGEYFWRVQAIAADGSTADYSPVHSFTIGSLAWSGHAAAPARQVVLDVPWFGQHKDTGMLLLESQRDSGLHAWDVPHPELDIDDPADDMNCTFASVSMVNAYYLGSKDVVLSQDRIGYEIYWKRVDGPEQDLSYGDGAWPDQVLPFALGGDVQEHSFDEGMENFWDLVKQEIDEQRPIVNVVNGHTTVITGYHEGADTKWVFINDPWDGQYAVDVDQLAIVTYYLLPSKQTARPPSDEPQIRIDTDGDRVVDFDEIHRFHTDPNDTDSDRDEIDDKAEIFASVFDPDHGYSSGSVDHNGRDLDGDGQAMELDPDSDGGGCFDGMEDFNVNGMFEIADKETYNFEKSDDACIWGTDETFVDTVFYHDTGDIDHDFLRLYATYSLKPEEGGKLTGSAQITYERVIVFIDPDLNECRVDTVTSVPAVVRWGAELTGTYQRDPDGTIRAGFHATPDHGPPYNMVSDCRGGSTVHEGFPWQGTGGQLKNGVYDFHYDLPLGSSETGEWWNRVHMEQSSGQ